MRKIALLALLMIQSVHCAETIKVSEGLKKVFGKHQTFKIRSALAENIICHHLKMCQKVDPIIYSLISKITITSKTFSEKIHKQLTLMMLDVSLKDLNKQCNAQMRLLPKHTYVSDQGDLEVQEASWLVKKVFCEEI